MNKEEDHINYERIEKVIGYMLTHVTDQPSLEELAEKVSLSPFHFQRIFSEWAGVSPKKFLQYISIQYAKRILSKPELTLFDTAHETGLSGTGRLHDLFVSIEGMTPGEYKNQGEKLTINYSYETSLFGHLLIASTHKGICYMGFVNQKEAAFNELKQRFPKANFKNQKDIIQQNALKIYTEDWTQLDKIKLHLKGTDFQLKVWEALLKISMGELSTYGSIANEIKSPQASRAVGTAIGRNPIGFLIPCHRIIQASGILGGYMWGLNRKAAMIGWEAAKTRA